MCPWMGLHFYDWIDYNGVTNFRTFGAKTVRHTVEPRSTDTLLIRTPRYYGQFGIPRPKAHTFL